MTNHIRQTSVIIRRKMKLYEIAPEIEALHNQMIIIANNDDFTETQQDELLQELNNHLNSIRQKLEDKALDIACLFKEELAEAQAIKDEIDRLNKRMKSHKNSADFWKSYLQNNITKIKYEDGRARISWRISQSLHVDPLTEIPEEYQRIKIEPDKTAIKKAIENGIFAPTNEIFIEEKENIQIK